MHSADGLHVRVRSSKTDQEGQGVVRALPYGRDPKSCPPCALVRWRRLFEAYDAGDRAGAMAELRKRGLSTEHVCRGIEDTKPGPTVDADGEDSLGAGGGGGERWPFPTVHKTGATGESDDR